jgi:hypothetical protein
MMLLSKRMLRPTIVLALVASSTLANASTVTVFSKSAATSTTTTTTQGVKWHPGNYLLVYDTTTDSGMLNIISTLDPAFRGVQRNYSWKNIEPTEGQYNFTSIQNDLATASAYGKRLVIAIQTETFNQPGVTIAPTYLLNSKYGGGIYTTRSGTNAAYFNTAVQDRLVALYQALGKSFDTSSNLEAITLPETAPSEPNSTWITTYLNNYTAGMTRIALAAKTAFPHTVVIQYINYPTSIIPTMVSTLKSSGVGVGGPDVLVADTGLINGSYPYIKGLANQVPVGIAAQYENYSALMHGGAYSPPGANNLYMFARDQLQANYIFWLRRTAESATAANGYHASNYYQNVRDYLAPMNWASDPAGGLNTTCPAMFKKCVN